MQTAQTTHFRSVPDLIAQVGGSYRESIALSDGEHQLSYQELNCRADRFAGYLAQMGIESGASVALCMERSFDWIVAALGIMRAGATYVPLDSNWPDSRLRFAVKDSGATALVARKETLSRLQVKVHGIDPRRDAAAMAAAPSMPPRQIQPESLAYVIYTSGSSGAPKGVEITHANVSHLVQWHQAQFGVTCHDRASHLLALGFDAAVLEIWGHLCAGATLCLMDDLARSSTEWIQQWILHERVTICLVPAVFGAQLMTMKWPASTALRLLIAGGEALQHGPAVGLPFTVVNHYGPTECTVVSTWAALEPGADEIPPIGVPVAGARVYLLDEDGRQVPDGVVGEIYIGGSGVGRGYRNLEEATRQSFLPDPFAGVAGARMYRSGDRGVRKPDGQLEFRGRLDRQTKIRGQRVELDEIANVLGRHPSVDFATAIARISQGATNQLVAYVLPKENALLPSANELQRHLLRDLPDYMIPTVFVRLQSLPLSANGKVDLAMLPQPADSSLLERTLAKAPATQIEATLLTTVRQLLMNEAVGEEDNFFLAGGHSLLGMQLLMRVRDAFGVDLGLRQLLEAPTVQRLAAVVKTAIAEDCIRGIWGDLLGRKQIELDDNFFELGGHPELMTALQLRITAEFGLHLPSEGLLHAPTVRLQTELIQRTVKAKPELPAGVLAIQPKGTGNGIFFVHYLTWVHYLQMNLAEALGDDRPLFFLILTAEDFEALGDAPSLQGIAGRMVRTILAIQPEGPYVIGGFDTGGVLAYEIAHQLQAGGHAVSSLMLLDPPNPLPAESRNSLTRKLNYLGYAARRGQELGVRTSLSYLNQHLRKRFSPILEAKPDRTERTLARDILQAAVLAYKPEEYTGKVHLLLPSNRPPLTDVLPAWEMLVPRGLRTQYVDGHHRDLLKAANADRVADFIVSSLSSAAAAEPLVTARLQDQSGHLADELVSFDKAS